jgi:hypothetical protein
MHGLRHRAPRLVHERAGQQQQNFFSPDRAFHRHALETPAPGRDAVALRDRLHRHETDIMPVADVAFARIAEADEKQHGITGVAVSERREKSSEEALEHDPEKWVPVFG